MNARPDPYTIIAALREENEALRWELEDIRARIAPPMTFPAPWRLTPTEGKILATILAASPEVATLERIACALYGDGGRGDAYQCIQVCTMRLRRKLAAAGFRDVIQTELRAGYRIHPGDRARIHSAIETAGRIGRPWRARGRAPEKRAA